jgi:hypothetical protein
MLNDTNYNLKIASPLFLQARSLPTIVGASLVGKNTLQGVNQNTIIEPILGNFYLLQYGRIFQFIINNVVWESWYP